MYSTDGTCGDQYGGRICAGIWGDCCNFDGKCGTGTAFCAVDSCQSGNCNWATSPPTPPESSYGNSTDGTCGAANGMTCGSLWGNCCNSDNVCGSLPSDCGVGCQPEWGTCDPVTTSLSSSATITTTKTTSTSATTTSTSVTTSSTSIKTTSTSTTTTSSTSTLPAISSLPSCGQLCFNNLIGQYSSLGCSSPDPSCLCSNVNFGYGIRDCSNGACGTDVASTVIAYESAYCASALATRSSTATPTATGITALPSCGQLCFNNLIGQYASLGCSSPDPACLCSNVNFGYGIRDCSNGACGTDVASTVIAYESAYCASATGASTAK
ncbi:hypothetical protein BJ166DRAFT_246707 [Pestalotiopsis sp. NC0098]|nr:hypothetical protein BJ166DRAFT_246707 [Pestalotiopsis sp. NC0098]